MELKLSKISIKVDPGRLPAPTIPKTPVLRPKPVMIRAEEKHTKKKHKQQSWTPERDECLIQLRREGKTMKQCADELGTSRGAVNKRLGRLRRMGVDV